MTPSGESALPWRDRVLALWKRRGWRGYLTLNRWLKPHGAQPTLGVVTRYGTRFLLHPEDSVDRHVLMEGFYESEVLESVRPSLANGTVLWVVGANFGLHAVTAKFLHPTCRVIAFEPVPATGSRLIEHGRLNRAQPDLVSLALSDQAATLPFYVNDHGNPGASTLHPVATETYHYCVIVAAERADALIDSGRLPAPNVMIVDAERAELEVFRGMGRHLFSPDLKCVVFEAENELLNLPEPTPLLCILRDAGFKVTRLERREHTAHGCSNFLGLR